MFLIVMRCGRHLFLVIVARQRLCYVEIKLWIIVDKPAKTLQGSFDFSASWCARHRSNNEHDHPTLHVDNAWTGGEKDVDSGMAQRLSSLRHYSGRSTGGRSARLVKPNCWRKAGVVA